MFTLELKASLVAFAPKFASQQPERIWEKMIKFNIVILPIPII